MVATNKKRRYEDYCAAAHALDIIGERWALLIVRDLLLGPKRFSDLRDGLASISPNVLTQRLNDMESNGVVVRHKLPRPANAWVYELTQWGHELEPLVMQLARWGVRSAYFERGKALGADALILSLKAMFEPGPNRRAPLCIGLRIQDEDFYAVVANRKISVGRGCASAPDATIEAPTQILLGLAYGGLDPGTAAQTGMVRYHGKLSALRRFFSMFSLPLQAPTAAELAPPQR